MEDDYAELRRHVKQIISFLYTTFGHYPSDLHRYAPLVEKDSLMLWAGWPVQPMTAHVFSL